MSIHVQVPDGTSFELEEGASTLDLAVKIGPGLAKAAVIGEVNGQQVDLDHRLSDGDTVRIITTRDPEGPFALRHSCAHLMAEAILDEFPGAQLTIGPSVEDGFYYDVHLSEGKITEEDFSKIEKRMQVLLEQDPGSRGSSPAPRTMRSTSSTGRSTAETTNTRES